MPFNLKIRPIIYKFKEKVIAQQDKTHQNKAKLGFSIITTI